MQSIPRYNPNSNPRPSLQLETDNLTSKSTLPAIKAIHCILCAVKVHSPAKPGGASPTIVASCRPLKPSMSQMIQASAQVEVIVGGSVQGKGWPILQMAKNSDNDKGRSFFTGLSIYSQQWAQSRAETFNLLKVIRQMESWKISLFGTIHIWLS